MPWESLAVAATSTTFIERLTRLLSFSDYNTWVPLVATSLLGISAGVVGVFMVLRQRALVGDVVGHAALPGIVLAFLILERFAPGQGKSLPALLAGALVTGLAGAGLVLLIDRFSRTRGDAALAIVLSLFFGLGTVLLTAAQQLDGAGQAGLRDFLGGKTAALVGGDIGLTLVMTVVLTAITLLLFKEWTLLCFDDNYAVTIGRPVVWLDAALIGMAACVTILGMKSVGLVLVVALLVIPAAAARFWTDDIRRMTFLSGAIGGTSGAVGVALSSLAPRMAAGPTIVLVGSALFAISLAFGRRRGVLWAWLQQSRLRRDVARQDFLRAAFESVEERLGHVPSLTELTSTEVTLAGIQADVPGGAANVRRSAASAVRDGLLYTSSREVWRLTPEGAAAAARTTRNHRLWELYLLEYADVAPAHVHRSADLIEHVLDAGIVAELESLLAARAAGLPAVSR
jgi:manganese/zinc/iron transport system permease protein